MVLSHAAIFPATCNTVLLLQRVTVRCLKSYENNKIGTQFLAQLSKRVKMIVLTHKRKRLAIYWKAIFPSYNV